MEAPRSVPVQDGRRAWLRPALVGVLALFAYRALLHSVLASDYDVDHWLFRPSRLPPLLVLAVAGWLLWNRRARLRALPDRRAPLLATSCAALGTALFV